MGQNSPVSLTVPVPVAISMRVARGFQVPRPLLRPAGAVNTQHPTERSRSGTIRAPESNTRTRTMFAVIRTGGKQYRVAAEDVIKVEEELPGVRLEGKCVHEGIVPAHSLEVLLGPHPLLERVAFRHAPSVSPAV